MSGFLQRLKKRKLVRWAIAYIAAGFVLLQGIDTIAQRFGRLVSQWSEVG